MGYSKSKGKCHFVEVQSGFETMALCGARIERFVTKYFDDEFIPIPYASHWGGRYSNCMNCERLLKRRENDSMVN